MDQRKLNTSLDNPIDNKLNYLSTKLNPFFYKLGFTPNMLTTLSLVITFVGIYLLHHKNYVISSICIFIGYYFDCADGNFARTYEMTSKFGDYYDHISDHIKIIVLFIVIYKLSIPFKQKLFFYIIILFLIGGMVVHFGCQQKIVDNRSILDITKCFCKSKELIIYTRFFGSGTFFLFICIFIGSLNLNK